jgi:thymidylate synthase (FAD)
MLMKVRLVGYTQPAHEIEGLEDVQDLIAYAARVSNPSNQNNSETSTKLLNYLAKHKHWSPFEMASACLEVETTRDIARQLLRHRSFSFQEFSQRYADPTEDLDFVVREARLQDTKNRQNSIELNIHDNEEDAKLYIEWNEKQQAVIDAAKDAYAWAIGHGIAKEQARAVLPEGNTVSRLYVNGTIRSWIHYIELRSGNGTQLEHIELARACGEAITKIFPLAQEYINE